MACIRLPAENEFCRGKRLRFTKWCFQATSIHKSDEVWSVSKNF